MASNGARNYRIDIRAVVRGLWLGLFDYFQAWQQMDLAIRRGLYHAWREGSGECGIMPSEWTQEEKAALKSRIFGELGYIDGFLTAIEAGSKAGGGKLGPLMGRAEMWILRFMDVKNQAMRISCENQKLVWRLGPTRDHCRDCLRLAGRVYRAKTWERWEIQPQSHQLACGGWRCLCFFEVTDEPCTPGRPPKLSGQ